MLSPLELYFDEMLIRTIVNRGYYTQKVAFKKPQADYAFATISRAISCIIPSSENTGDAHGTR
jgi:hypothetical protein